jgi:hypothetical protein
MARPRAAQGGEEPAILFASSLDSVEAVSAPEAGAGATTNLAPEDFVAGQDGEAAGFTDGQYVRIPTTQDGVANLALDRGSIEFWYRPDYAAADQSELRVLVQVGPFYDVPRLQLTHLEWLSLSATTADWTTVQVTTPWGAALWSAGGWVHVRADWDAADPEDSLRLYLNGERVDGGGAPGGWDLGAPESVVVGAGSEAGEFPARGAIDELKIWDAPGPAAPPAIGLPEPAGESGEAAPPVAGEGVDDAMAALDGLPMVMPSPMDRPALGEVVADPAFGTPLRRATDRSEAGPADFEVTTYSQLQAFSPDGNYLLLTSNTGYLVRRLDDLQRLDGLDLGEINNPRWHPIQPHHLVHFDTNADADVTIQMTDVERGATTDLTTLPGLVRIDVNRSFDELSQDGRWLAGLGYQEDESPAIFAWDLEAGRFGAYLPLFEMFEERCEPDPTWGVLFPDWIAPSPLGTYLVVQWERGGPVACGGLETFDPRSGEFVGRVYDGHQHSDLGVSVDGREFLMVYETYHPSGMASIGVRWLPGTATVGEPTYVLVLPDWFGGHISCQGPPGQCLITTSPVPDNGWQPLEAEIFLLSLDGTVRRLAHHRSSDCGYWTQPHGTLSRDGTMAAFNSDWGAATCGPANEGLGTADAYVLEL